MSDVLLDNAVTAAREAGAHLRRAFGHGAVILSDAGKDLKISADKEAEKIIFARLAAVPGDAIPILSEEAGLVGDAHSGAGKIWVVDPLDGTLNFSRGIPLCCVSIALWENGEPALGVIYDFMADIIYSGVVGRGAWRNGVPMRASATQARSKAVFATGFPSGADYGEERLLAFVKQVQDYKKVRLLGSAALSLALVAAGAMDAYGENGIYFWDVAAGLALVTAAGGKYVKSQPDERWRCNVVAGAAGLQI